MGGGTLSRVLTHSQTLSDALRHQKTLSIMDSVDVHRFTVVCAYLVVCMYGGTRSQSIKDTTSCRILWYVDGVTLSRVLRHAQTLSDALRHQKTLSIMDSIDVPRFTVVYSDLCVSDGV